MTPEEKALRDAFLAECWAPVREESREVRAERRRRDREMQREMEDREAAARLPKVVPGNPQESANLSTDVDSESPAQVRDCA